jgi:small-conductance mechanosensitive channel
MQRWSGFSAWLEANDEALLTGTLVAVALVAGMLVLRHLGERICASHPDYRSWKTVVGRVLAKTSLAFMIIAALAIVTNFAEPPRGVGRLVEILFIIAFAIQGAVWARELILGVIGRQVSDDSTDSALGNAKAVIRVLVSVALFAIAIVVILDNLGVNVTALVAGLGIGGIAIGLAAQGIFSDLFASLSILFDKPFRRGDTIRFDTATGRVERIGLKTTRLRSLGGEQIIMANTKLLEREIHNLADGGLRRATIAFGVAYETPPELLARMEEIARAAVDPINGCTLLRCSLANFGVSSLDYQLIYEDKSVDPDRLARDRAAIMLALIERFAAEKIAFAYPVQIALGPDAAR